MDRAVLIESLLLMALASLGLFEGARLTTVSLVSPEPLGPGWYLVVVSGLLFAFGAHHLAARAKLPTTRAVGSLSFRFGAAARALGLLILYAAAMPVVGYLASTAAFFALALRIFGVGSWIRSVVIGVVLAALFEYGFANLGGMVLP